MGCCCWSLPIRSPSLYNVVSFENDGTIRWQQRWEAIDGQAAGGMDIPFRVAGDQGGMAAIHALGTKLVAVGVKDGTVHTASLNLSDGSVSLALTDSGETAPFE